MRAAQSLTRRPLGKLLGAHLEEKISRLRRSRALGPDGIGDGLGLPYAEGEAEFLAPGHPEHGGSARKLPHAREELLALGDAHGAAGVQDVERVRRLEELIKRGEGQPGVEHAVGLLVSELEPELVRGDVRSSMLNTDISYSFWRSISPYVMVSLYLMSLKCFTPWRTS